LGLFSTTARDQVAGVLKASSGSGVCGVASVPSEPKMEVGEPIPWDPSSSATLPLELLQVRSRRLTQDCSGWASPTAESCYVGRTDDRQTCNLCNVRRGRLRQYSVAFRRGPTEVRPRPGWGLHGPSLGCHSRARILGLQGWMEGVCDHRAYVCEQLPVTLAKRSEHDHRRLCYLWLAQRRCDY
jgi:hypothetical protein